MEGPPPQVPAPGRFRPKFLPGAFTSPHPWRPHTRDGTGGRDILKGTSEPDLQAGHGSAGRRAGTAPSSPSVYQHPPSFCLWDRRHKRNFGWDIYNEDFRGLQALRAGSVDVVFTSPPYKAEDGFTLAMICDLVGDLVRVMARGGIIYMNFGQMAHHKSDPFRVAELLESEFNFIDTIIWEKPQYGPVQGRKRLNNRFEYIFMYSNGMKYQLDRLSIGVPYEDKSNIGRYSDEDNHCRGNVWRVGYETHTRAEQKLHPHRFPVELVELGLKLANKPGGHVLDPFMGSGSAGVAALNLGMSFTGYEIDPDRFLTARDRLNEWRT